MLLYLSNIKMPRRCHAHQPFPSATIALTIWEMPNCDFYLIYYACVIVLKIEQTATEKSKQEA